MKKLSLLFLFCIGCTRPIPVEECEEEYWTPATPIAGQMARAIRADGKIAFQQGYHRLAAGKARGTLLERAGVVPIDQAEASRLHLNMQRGILELGGASDDLVSAEFQLMPESDEPLMNYRTGSLGRIIAIEGTTDDEFWKVQLNRHIPVGMRIDTEGGFREIDLKHIPLTDFTLRALEGNSVVALTGDQPELAKVQISQGSGSIALDMFGDYESLIEVNVDTAHGDISGEFTGYYSRLERLNITSTEGDIDLNFDGAWQRICQIVITATCGDLRIRLPCGIGASVIVDPCIDNVETNGLDWAWPNSAWVTSAYGKSDVFLDIRVKSTNMGKVYVYQDRGGDTSRLVYGKRL